MKRLTLFAKGNLDVRDTLHSLWVDGEVRWNGINALLREHDAPLSIRVKHETCSRSDMLLAVDGTIPPELAARDLPLGAHGLRVQFGTSLFTERPDAYVLSLQPEIQIPLAVHRDGSYRFHAYGFESWPAEQRQWLRDTFTLSRSISVDESMANFQAVIARLRAGSDAPILVYNVSALVPGENIHCHAGMEDIYSTRIRRFNLALVELSQQTGISIVDVDRVIATHGAQALKFDTTHLNPAGCRAVAEEVLRVLLDHGLYDAGDWPR